MAVWLAWGVGFWLLWFCWGSCLVGLSLLVAGCRCWLVGLCGLVICWLGFAVVVVAIGDLFVYFGGFGFAMWLVLDYCWFDVFGVGGI